jgi:hypothetical protein
MENINTYTDFYHFLLIIKLLTYFSIGFIILFGIFLLKRSTYRRF